MDKTQLHRLPKKLTWQWTKSIKIKHSIENTSQNRSFHCTNLIWPMFSEFVSALTSTLPFCTQFFPALPSPAPLFPATKILPVVPTSLLDSNPLATTPSVVPGRLNHGNDPRWRRRTWHVTATVMLLMDHSQNLTWPWMDWMGDECLLIVQNFDVNLFVSCLCFSFFWGWFQL